MKIYFSLAKRSNPDKNPSSQPIELLGRFMQDKSYFISFVNIEKLGLNPKSKYETPLGIYCYRLADYHEEITYVHNKFAEIAEQEYYAKGKEKDVLRMEKARKEDWNLRHIFPFATNADYIYFFQHIHGNLLDLQAYSESDLEEDYRKLVNGYGFTLSMCEDPPLVDTPGGKLWNYTYFLAKKLSVTNKYPVIWNKIFQYLGYIGATDNGDGIIHGNEIKQTVFFTNSVLKKKTVLENKTKTIDKNIYYHNITQQKKENQLKLLLANPKAVKWLRNPDEDLLLQLIHLKLGSIYWIKNPSEKLQLAAIDTDVNEIHNIRHPTEAVKLAVVNKKPMLIKVLDKPSEEVQLAAVKKDTYALQYIDHPSLTVQEAAIKESPYVIQFIKNPSEELQLLAIETNRNAIAFIKNPTPKVKELTKDIK